MKKNYKIAYNPTTGKEEIYLLNKYGLWVKKAEARNYREAKLIIEEGYIY